jgi:hypothetical protein
VELYSNRTREGRSLVASGERSTDVGTVNLSQENSSGLSGVVDISYNTTDSNNIELHVIPNFLSTCRFILCWKALFMESKLCMDRC